MKFGNKYRRSGNKSPIQECLNLDTSREKIQLNKSKLSKNLDSYPFRNNQQTFPKLEKKFQKALQLQPIKHMHILYAPAQIPRSPEDLLQKILSRNKRPSPKFGDMKKKFNQTYRLHKKSIKSQDDKMLLHIQEITETRPKSVLFKKKISCIMQTDDL